MSMQQRLEKNIILAIKRDKEDELHSKDITVINLFEQQVQKHPHKIAVSIGPKNATYEELNQRANYIGKLLRDKFITKEDIVAVFTERSIEMIVGILGVLKAGAAFLPIDINNPKERIHYILNDSGARAIITSTAKAEELADITELDNITVAWDNYKKENLGYLAGPKNLAYVIYTSGTTGKPKGVMLEDRGLANFVKWKIADAMFDEDSVVLQKATSAFDAAVGEIFLALLGGTTLQLLTEKENEDFDQLLNIIRSAKVSHMVMIPTILSAILEHMKETEKNNYLDNIKRLYIAGEQLNIDLLQKYSRITGKDWSGIYNLYGPTEATICATAYNLKNYDGGSVIPIGKPINNVQLYVLNGESLCGNGEEGELCIGGLGIARGYLNNQKLTDEKFINNPFQEKDTIYRSGDLVIKRDDGNIEFVGRMDDQIKLHGLRIELGEIRSRMLEFPGVSDVVVVVHNQGSDKFLCSYLVGADGIDTQKLRMFLHGKLPEYMIPKYIMQLARMPLTTNGKLDKNALPLPVIIDKTEYKKPKTREENILVSVFQEIFNTKDIGVNHDFFDLGGDSIKAIRMISKIKSFHYECTVKEIMKERVVKNIARMMMPMKEQIHANVEIQGEVPFTPIQNFFFNSKLEEPEHFNQTFLLEGKYIGEAALQNALAVIVKHHDMLRAVFPEGKQIIRSANEENLFEFYLQEMDLPSGDYKAEMLRVGNEFQKGFDLSRGPLVKGILFKTPETDYFLLMIHHLIVDGISWRILVEDLNTVYVQIKNGKTVKLPTKTLSFQQWSECLKQYSLSNELQSEILYWKEIEEIAKYCEFPLHQDTGDSGKRFITYEFDEDTTQKLLLHSSEAYNTEINDLLLTALFRSVSKITKAGNVIINLEGHGREPIHIPTAIDRTVGWFTIVYPVAVTEIGKTMRGDIITVKESLRSIPNHGLGYGVLANYTEELEGIIPNVTFNYLGDFGNETERYELKINTIEYGEQVSPKNQFGSPIAIDGSIADGKLQIVIYYNPSVCSKRIASRLANLFTDELRHVVDHCLQKKISEKTASDYGETGWSREEFYKLQQKLAKRNAKIERIYPLTPMQEGILFSEISGKKQNSYVIISEYEIWDSVDVKKLRESFELLIQKYSVLRSNFLYHGFAELRQIIRTDCSVEFQIVELGEQAEKELEAIKTKEFNRGFDLENDSLLRVTIAQNGMGISRLILSFHHIIMDGWCTQFLLDDLNFFYAELNAKKTKDQLTKNIEPDFAHERYARLLNQMDKGDACKYWEHLLKDYNTYAIIRPEGIARNFKSITDHKSCKLNGETAEKMNRLCSSMGVTASVFFEAVWGLLLGEYTGTSDIVFGRVVSGRDKCFDSIESAVGLFINTIPVRFCVNKEQTFRESLRGLHNQLLESGIYDYCSLADIQSKSVLGSDLIQSLVAFENYDQTEEKAPLGLELVKTIEQANYLLTLSIKKTKTYKFELIYDSECYTDVEVKIILEKYQDLLVRFIENPDILLSDIELCTEDEVNKIIYEFNNTFTEYPRDKTIAELFEKQVELSNDKIAISYKNEEMTYRQLNDKANQIAHALRAAGIRTGEIVGVSAERNMQTIVNFLAVIKAGGGYLPLDIKNPIERTKFILTDSNSKIVIDNNDMLRLQGIPDVTKLGSMQLKIATAKNPDNRNQPEDVAYIIYTSGTTGEPKGTIISQKSVLGLVLHANYISFDDIRILQTGSLTFDACTFEIWGALLNGGKVHIADEDILYDTAALNRCISQKRINSMFLTTALFNQIIDIDPMAFKGLKELLVGGEKMARSPVEVFKKNHPDIIFSNIYGPTECTTFALSEKLEDYVPNVIPIGKPISNTTAYVLRERKLCGVGIPGELCIGGDGVATGYLNQKELSKEKFIENPFVKGEKIYRTGDLVRWLHNGSIDYLGRIDQQVKIRGFRIELDEVTNAIKELSKINDAIVTVYENHNDKYLCAYVQVANEFDSTQIRVQLRKRLPEYMVPPYIIMVDHLPVNKNGKIDKQALPKPQISSSKEYRSPRTDVEWRIANLFKEVLDIHKVSVNDYFMELGGHSLKAIRLTSLLKKEFNCNLLTRDILENGTVEKLAAIIESSEKASQYEPIKRYHENSMSSAQKRLFTLHQLNKESIAYNIPLALCIEGEIETEKIISTIKELSQRHDILRTYFEADENGFYQRIAECLEIDFTRSEVEWNQLNESIWNTQKAFDLSIPPLFRVHLFQVKNRGYVLLIDIHHTIFDGGSVGTFVKELCMLYNCEPLEHVKLQYRDYAGWMKQMDGTSQAEFWKAELSDLNITTTLREDFPRQQDKTYEGASIDVAIEKEVQNKLNALGKLLGATSYMIYLAAVAELLSRYVKEEKVVLGIAMSGRTHPDLQDMIGMFVNTLVYVGDIEKGRTFSEHVLLTKEKCLQIFENQDYQFEDMIENIRNNRELSRNPFFDIMFSMEKVEAKAYKIGNAKLSEYHLPNHTAKFDLVINIKESKDSGFVCWEYNKSLYKKETIETLAAHFNALLKNLLEQPDVVMEQIAGIDKSEHAKILENFVEPKKQHTRGCTVSERFEEVTAENPDGIAAELENKFLTYRQLNNRANYIAKCLRDEGITRNDIVAVSLERSFEMLIAIVGILKSGAAYLPIDPGSPLERTNFILNDSKTKILLAGTDSQEFMVKALNILKMDGECETVRAASDPEDLAYVIYTSGTTGNPKGVMIEQHSLINLMDWQIKEGKVNSDSVILQKSTYTFDASVWEIFLAILSGGKLQMLTEEENKDFYLLLEIIKSKGITHMLMIPTVFDAILDYMKDYPRYSLQSLKRIYLGAEAVTAELLSKYATVTGESLNKVRNLYGPTEGTVCATYYDFTEYDGCCSVPIGRPIANAKVYIMEEGELCGIGMPGEICIGGSGVARGYLQQEKLTAEKFIDNPWSPGEIIYRTGDLAKWRADGTIDYLGRADDQVKIRGFRVELDEIRKKIQNVQGVKRAAVVLYDGNGSEKQVGAYAVMDSDCTVDKISNSLTHVLPHYMIPAFIIQVESIPTTANGKLDKKALPSPESIKKAEFVEPRNEEESILVEIFKDILSVKEVGIYDNFFDLGGHSMKATILVRKIEKRLGIRLSLKDVMMGQNINNIVKKLNKKMKFDIQPLGKAKEVSN